VFLASKAEEHRVRLYDLARAAGVDHSLVAARERELLAGLRFHLQVSCTSQWLACSTMLGYFNSVRTLGFN
jgi:hypothetical protein